MIDDSVQCVNVFYWQHPCSFKWASYVGWALCSTSQVTTDEWHSGMSQMLAVRCGPDSKHGTAGGDKPCTCIIASFACIAQPIANLPSAGLSEEASGASSASFCRSACGCGSTDSGGAGLLGVGELLPALLLPVLLRPEFLIGDPSGRGPSSSCTCTTSGTPCFTGLGPPLLPAAPSTSTVPVFACAAAPVSVPSAWTASRLSEWKLPRLI